MTEDTDEFEKVRLGRLSDVLGFRLRRVQNQLSRDFADRTRSWNMRAGMFSALEIIASNHGISQAELSVEVGLDKSAMVQIVDDMEARGWVVRTRSTSDRRRNDLSVTELGSRELTKMVDIMHGVEQVGLAALTDAERLSISSGLDKVYRAYVKGVRED